ncbi:MAG: YgfZ/GcvT domain-containing protein [Cellvibrionaceae bacterium]
MSHLSNLESLKKSVESVLDLEKKSYAADLDQLACIIVSGKDARSFLQGQVTCDMNSINQQRSLPGAHCTNKGRVVFTFRAIELPNTSENNSHEQEIALIIPSELIETAVNTLSKYIVFSKATIRLAEDIKILGIFGKGVPEIIEASRKSIADPQKTSALSISDNQTMLLIQKNDVDQLFASDESVIQTDFSKWQLANIRNGIAEVYDGASELFLPQMLNFDNNEGISYKKGCYTGQEIVARMHHKGKLKRHLRRASLEHCKSGPTPGKDLYTDQSAQSIGHIVISAPVGPDSFETLIVATDETFDAQKIYLDQEKTIKLHPLPLPYAINN